MFVFDATLICDDTKKKLSPVHIRRWRQEQPLLLSVYLPLLIEFTAVRVASQVLG